MNSPFERGDAAADSPEGIDLDVIVQIAGGDRALLRELLGGFLNEIPILVARLDDSVARGDGPAVKDAAHKLKGVLRYLRMENACAEVAVMETLAGRDDRWRELRRLADQVRAQTDAALNTLTEFVEQPDDSD